MFVKCGLCRGFGLVKVKKCQHCVICPHCRGMGKFEIGNPGDKESDQTMKKYALDILQYKKEYIPYSSKNRPPFQIVLN